MRNLMKLVGLCALLVSSSVFAADPVAPAAGTAAQKMMQGDKMMQDCMAAAAKKGMSHDDAMKECMSPSKDGKAMSGSDGSMPK